MSDEIIPRFSSDHPDPPPHELADMKQMVHKHLPRQVHGGRERTNHRNSCARAKVRNIKTSKLTHRVTIDSTGNSLQFLPHRVFRSFAAKACARRLTI